MGADVNQAPGAHPVALRVRPAQHPGLQRRLLPRRQRLRTTGAAPVVETGKTLGVVADHGVPQRLPLHPGQASGFGPREAVERVGDRQQARGGTPVRLAPCQAAELLGGQVLADGERGHGGGSPPTIPLPLRPARNLQIRTSVRRYHMVVEI